MYSRLITPPVDDPITLTEARLWVGMQSGVTADDTKISPLIDSVTRIVEGRTQALLGARSMQLVYDAAEISTRFVIPAGLVPLQYVQSIVTTDADGVETTVATDQYMARVGEYPRIVLAESGSWPGDYRTLDAMAINIEAGFGPVAGVGSAQASGTPTLNDATVGGSHLTTVRARVEIEVDAQGTPDTFKHRLVTISALGVETEGAWTAGVAMTGSAQTLTGDVTVTFGATTGHGLADAWTIDLYGIRLPEDWRQLLEGLTQHLYYTSGTGVRSIGDGMLSSVPRFYLDELDRLRMRSGWLV